jgi:hypothetical protein
MADHTAIFYNDDSPSPLLARMGFKDIIHAARYARVFHPHVPHIHEYDFALSVPSGLERRQPLEVDRFRGLAAVVWRAWRVLQMQWLLDDVRVRKLWDAVDEDLLRCRTECERVAVPYDDICQIRPR